MKKYLFIILLVGVGFGQDYLITLDGKEFPGNYISHNETTINFKRETSKGISSFNIASIKGIRLANGKMLNLELPEDVVSTITFKKGPIKNGYIKSASLKNNIDIDKISFKEKISDEYFDYNKNDIILIKSWNGKRLFPLGVVGNIETGKYHLPNVRHLPTKNKSVSYESEEEAEKNKLSKCYACFDSSPFISDYHLEKALVHHTILAYQNQNEILYEHKELGKVQRYIDKILAKWPETLKGYDYRIQIVRDNNPNAFAVGGGNLYITSGFLDVIESDYELESILAHEIAHVEKRHTLRSFYYAQKKKDEVAFKALLTGLTVIALGGSAEQTNFAANLVTAVAGFSAELAKSGYNRELEQEADILAQIYLDENKYDKMNMVSLFDKLITYTVSRGGFFMDNAYSSHPALLNRIKQVETSEIYRLDNPLILKSNTGGRSDIPPNFFELKINYIYKASSSHVSGEEMLYILGDIKNNHKDFAFNIDDVQMKLIEKKIVEKTEIKPSNIITKAGKEIPINYISHDENNIKFTYIGKDQVTSIPLTSISDFTISGLVSGEPLDDLHIGGLSGTSINYSSEHSFMGSIKESKLNTVRIFQAIKEKSIMINSIKLSPMVLKQDNPNIKLNDFGAINAMMKISN